MLWIPSISNPLPRMPKQPHRVEVQGSDAANATGESHGIDGAGSTRERRRWWLQIEVMSLSPWQDASSYSYFRLESLLDCSSALAHVWGSVMQGGFGFTPAPSVLVALSALEDSGGWHSVKNQRQSLVARLHSEIWLWDASSK